MLKRWVVALAFLLLTASAAFGQQPDPRDSVILESKVLAPGLSGHPAFTMKVYITNKDTLAGLTLMLEARTIAGTAYAVLDSGESSSYYDSGWIFQDVVTPLKGTLHTNPAEDFYGYDGSSPDTFLISGWFSPTFATPNRYVERPNITRSAIWEIKFMSTSNSLGEIQFDTVRLNYIYLTQFTTYCLYDCSKDIPVNFVKSVITLLQPLKGDMNLDAQLRPADVVLHLNCVMLGAIPPVGPGYCDLNCDGEATAADVVLELNAVFREEEFPC